MWSYLSSLPCDVLTQHILRNLCVKDLVRLDSAILNHKFRFEFHNVLPYCSPFTIKQHSFWNKKINFTWIKLRNIYILKLTCYISKISNWIMDVDQIDEVTISTNIELQDHHIKQLSTINPNAKITLDICNQNYQDSTFVLQLLSHFTNIQNFIVEIYHESEIPWLQYALEFITCKQTINSFLLNITPYWGDFILKNCNHITTLNFFGEADWYVDSTEWLGKLGSLGMTSKLHNLYLSTSLNSVYSINNTGLISFFQYNNSINSNISTIHTLAIDNVSVNDNTVTVIATHCPLLQSFSIYYKGILTYISLIALSKHCKYLKTLWIPYIPIPNKDLAIQCSHALSCINRIYNNNITNISYSIPYMTSLNQLSITNSITTIEINTDFTAVSLYCRQLEYISIYATTIDILELLIILIKNNSYLTSITLHNATVLTDTILIQIIQYSSNLNKLTLYHATSITDLSIINIPKYCPKLTYLFIRNSPLITANCKLALSKQDSLLTHFCLLTV